MHPHPPIVASGSGNKARKRGCARLSGVVVVFMRRTRPLQKISIYYANSVLPRVRVCE